MTFKKLTPMLYTHDVEGTIDFYTTYLGFICGDKNGEWNWAAMHRDEVDIMLAKPNEQTPFEKSVFTGSFYIYVDNVDSLWEQLKNRVKICYAIENFDWKMREFAIYDNNGYVIQIGQDIS